MLCRYELMIEKVICTSLFTVTADWALQNNNHKITYPQIYLQGEHIGSLHDLEHLQSSKETWQLTVNSIRKGFADKNEPSASMQ